MNYQQTSWNFTKSFSQVEDIGEVYDWKGRKKSIVITQKELDETA